MAPDPLDAKQSKLEAVLRALDGAVVAFSGGVDSAYLLAAALDTLGPRRSRGTNLPWRSGSRRG
jgi:PP-loop superfamily ATP-utilizing enzyme